MNMIVKYRRRVVWSMVAATGACALAIACSDSPTDSSSNTIVSRPDSSAADVTVTLDSGDQADTSPVTPVPDAGCIVITPTGLKLTNSSFTPDRLSGDLVENIGDPNHTDDAGFPWDRIHLDLHDPGAVDGGHIDLGAGDQGNTATCKECIRVYQDFGVKGQSLIVSKIYFQAGGTMDVTVRSVNDAGVLNGAAGTLSNVVLKEVVQGDGGFPGPLPPGREPSTIVPNGACLSIPSYSFSQGIVDGG